MPKQPYGRLLVILKPTLTQHLVCLWYPGVRITVSEQPDLLNVVSGDFQTHLDVSRETTQLGRCDGEVAK